MIASNRGSASRRASRRPSPQPRSRTRRAPAAASSARTASARRSRRRARAGAGVRVAASRVAVGGLVAVGGHSAVVGELGQGLAGQRGLVLQVAADDHVPLRVAGQPLRGRAGELADLISGDPVVLAVVQHRQQHVQVAEQVLDPAGAGQPDAEVRAVTPVGEVRVQRDGDGADLVAKRLEQLPQQGLAAAAGQHRQLRGQLEKLAGQLRAGLAGPAQRGAEHPAQRHRQERRRRVRPVVDVPGQREPARLGGGQARALAPRQRDRVHLDQQRDRAPLRPGLGVERVRDAEPDVHAAQRGRVLVQHEPQVGGGRGDAGDGQQHAVPRLGRSPAYARPRPGRVALNRALGQP